ncbi:hypothetical protein JTE90_004346 [Oedothorax gibbosus]|uniref:Large ribosomal subunit protein mL46 n=1 Tax=Oedothorax gibbosus TaxID=931172 RepID=A0AAV6VKS9_9ARAC|nr:hypothetical protein JTE90_004346 [Oedothorax gibbosus]
MKLKSCATLFFRTNSILKGNAYKHNSVLIAASRTFSNWHIVGALCLERKPVITQPLTPLEKKYYDYMQKLEVEQSLLSDHEKRHLEDKKINEKLKKGELEDMDSIAKQTAQDFEDLRQEQFNKYKPNERESEDDKTDNKQSLRRKLDSSLVLVIKQKLGNDHRWVLPQTIHQNGETLKQTAERVLKEICPNPPKIRIMGNAPVGYYKYKYPKVAREDGVFGAKVFFFRGQLLEKNVKFLDINQTDSLWLTHNELNEVLQKDYGKAVQSFLFPDFIDVDNTDYSLYSSEDENDMKTTASN